MTEIDHDLHDISKPSPEPALPILASQLLDLEEQQRTIFSENGRVERVKTGCSEIDELLGGGIERGIMVGISAEGNAGRLISLHLLASILVSHVSASTQPKSRAIVVDTTGSFPLTLLAKILKSRLLLIHDLSVRALNHHANHPIVGPAPGSQLSLNIDDEVRKCLEMVAISRIFDIEGLWEVLGEVGRDTHDLQNPVSEHTEDIEPLEIIDSQDEEVISIDETNTPRIDTAASSQTTEIIIIDNMTGIISDLFARKERGDAHILLALLSQTLHGVSQRQNIITILQNNVVPSKSAFNTNPQNRQQNQPNKIKPSVPESIFPSNTIKPALGQIFASIPSLHLFCSSLPKSRENAERWYGRDDDSARDTGDVEWCILLEVLKDETPILGSDKEAGHKFGWREQRWTALNVNFDGTALVNAFQESGNMRGMGLERENVGGLTEVGRIAKVYGFSGRRA